MTPNEFFQHCEMLGNEIAGCGPISVDKVKPLVDWYVKQDGNSLGGVLAPVLSDGNVTDEAIRRCFEFGKECGDWCGSALAAVLRGVDRAKIKLLLLKGKQP